MCHGAEATPEGETFQEVPKFIYLIQVIPNSEGLEPARAARDDAGPRFAVHPTRAPCFLGRPSLLVAASGHPFFWWALRDPVAVGPDRDGVAVDRHGTATTRVEIKQCVGCTRRFFTKSFLGDDVAVLAPSSGDEPASPRHRAGVASMAWRTDDATIQHERAVRF